MLLSELTASMPKEVKWRRKVALHYRGLRNWAILTGNEEMVCDGFYNGLARVHDDYCGLREYIRRNPNDPDIRAFGQQVKESELAYCEGIIQEVESIGRAMYAAAEAAYQSGCSPRECNRAQIETFINELVDSAILWRIAQYNNGSNDFLHISRAIDLTNIAFCTFQRPSHFVIRKAGPEALLPKTMEVVPECSPDEPAGKFLNRMEQGLRTNKTLYEEGLLVEQDKDGNKIRRTKHSLDTPMSSDDGEGSTFIDYVTAPTPANEEIHAAERLAHLIEGVRLSKQERELLDLYLWDANFLEQGGNVEAARCLNMSPSQIGVIKQRLFDKIRRADVT